MNQFNCLIVDDEPIARDIIENYCGYIPALNIVGLCGSAFEAKTVIEQQKIDILFLDMNMPVLDGLAFLKILKVTPQVIFTTAYKEYATDAFDLAACDYLLKPFSLERFIVAVDKAIENLQKKNLALPDNIGKKTDDFIFIRENGKIYKVLFDDLLYAEASGNNTKIVTAQNTHLPVMTLSGLEEQLPASIFFRVHRSFIINRSKITHIEGNRVFISKFEIPIGNNYREEFLKELGF